MPGYPLTVFISLYLPTAGKDDEFIEEISNLTCAMSEIGDKFKDPIFYLKGDANASIKIREKSKKRDVLFKHFIENLSLKHTIIDHHTYHHFVGGGLSDSTIDVLLRSAGKHSEKLDNVICVKENPDIDS